MILITRVGVARHVHLMRPATAQERDDVRVGWILQADDIEVSCLCL